MSLPRRLPVFSGALGNTGISAGTCLVQYGPGQDTSTVRPAYKDMSRGERSICALAALVAVISLVIVLTTPFGFVHNVASVLIGTMAAVIGLVSMRRQRRV